MIDVCNNSSKRTKSVILELDKVTHEYRKRGVRTVALRKVSVRIKHSQRVAIVGRSGAGKSTMVRLMAGFERPTQGAALFNGVEIPVMGTRGFIKHVQHVQYISQNASGSLNPALRVSTVINEVLCNLDVQRSLRAETVKQCLRQVALPVDFASRYVTELSEGQRQRVAIARALATGCQVIIADECFSGLDAMTASEIISTFNRVYYRDNVSIIYVSHDVTMVPRLADRIIVVEEGRIVEHGSTKEVLQSPCDPFTKELVSASCWLDWPTYQGEVPTGEGA